MLSKYLIFLFVVFIAACNSSKVVISTKNAPAAIGPYSQAILSGKTLYISGQIGIDPKTGNLISNSKVDEFNQIMKNHRAILEEAKMDFSNVVKVSIFLKDIADYKLINKEYAKYFNDNPPARETMEISNLPANANIEISLVAVK
ncbi:Rid family detoxifying hydrolase [Candidatus Kapabacteria bacterium]|nr:Rid family detoxifying hydrolase [Candidatus Kapabacteria bacterium]